MSFPCAYLLQRRKAGHLNHLTSLPPLVRNCGVVQGELITTLKRTRDLTQKRSSQEARITLKGNKLCTSQLFRRTLKWLSPGPGVERHLDFDDGCWNWWLRVETFNNWILLLSPFPEHALWGGVTCWLGGIICPERGFLQSGAACPSPVSCKETWTSPSLTWHRALWSTGVGPSPALLQHTPATAPTTWWPGTAAGPWCWCRTSANSWSCVWCKSPCCACCHLLWCSVYFFLGAT